MSKISEKRKRLDALRHPTIIDLLKTKIGPIWPPREELEGIPAGKRGVPRRKTKSPFDDKYREKRKRSKRRVNGYQYNRSGGKKKPHTDNVS